MMPDYSDRNKPFSKYLSLLNPYPIGQFDFRGRNAVCLKSQPIIGLLRQSRFRSTVTISGFTICQTIRCRSTRKRTPLLRRGMILKKVKQKAQASSPTKVISVISLQRTCRLSKQGFNSIRRRVLLESSFPLAVGSLTSWQSIARNGWWWSSSKSHEAMIEW